MAFARETLQIVVEIGNDDFKYPFEDQLYRYQGTVGSILGVGVYNDTRAFIPYTAEQLIRGNVASYVKCYLNNGKVVTFLCSASKLTTALNSVQTAGAYDAASLFGKQIAFGKPDANGNITTAPCVRASRVLNARVFD